MLALVMCLFHLALVMFLDLDVPCRPPNDPALFPISHESSVCGYTHLRSFRWRGTTLVQDTNEKKWNDAPLSAAVFAS